MMANDNGADNVSKETRPLPTDIARLGDYIIRREGDKVLVIHLLAGEYTVSYLDEVPTCISEAYREPVVHDGKKHLFPRVDVVNLDEECDFDVDDFVK